MISFLSWPILKTFLKGLPWDKILMWAIIAGLILWLVLSVHSFIKTAQKNAADVVQLKSDKADLTAANIALQESYGLQLKVLQGNIAANAEREEKYAKTIEEINKLPDSGCARSSDPIRASLRLLGGK